ncbi:four helix bundle protein [Hanamia caeni]|jgi:four helix bundle protein|uniref:Four helix bundle protein n=1 Tax=Hanamia caeni TaxID=2294116 RepID=A0A3M9NQA1_9BACT|nr:four helix bundle protein [Hanamia caeni]RNI39946.1 four helix bundle protein [Hanamia caeni]
MKKEEIESNPILKLTFEFSLLIIDYCDLLDERKKYTISRQLLKSGTSIGANCTEAQNAESKIDFIHKIKIAAKEADETQYWLLLCNYSDRYPECDSLLLKLESVQKVINKILGTAKRKTPISSVMDFFIF